GSIGFPLLGRDWKICSYSLWSELAMSALRPVAHSMVDQPHLFSSRSWAGKVNSCLLDSCKRILRARIQVLYRTAAKDAETLRVRKSSIRYSMPTTKMHPILYHPRVHISRTRSTPPVEWVALMRMSS